MPRIPKQGIILPLPPLVSHHRLLCTALVLGKRKPASCLQFFHGLRLVEGLDFSVVLYKFPRVVMTNYHKRGALKQQNLSSYRSSGGQKSNINFTGRNQGVGRQSHRRLSERICSLPFPTSGGHWSSLACSSVTPVIVPKVTLPSLLYVSNVPLPLSYKDTCDCI